jgi:hypothetical protein
MSLDFKQVWYVMNDSVDSQNAKALSRCLFKATCGDVRLWGPGDTEEYLTSWEANAGCARMALQSAGPRVFKPLCDGFEVLEGTEFVVRKVDTDCWWAPSPFWTPAHPERFSAVRSDPRCIAAVRAMASASELTGSIHFALVPSICAFKVECLRDDYYEDGESVSWSLDTAAMVDDLMQGRESPAVCALRTSGMLVKDFETYLRQDTRAESKKLGMYVEEDYY